MIDDITEWFYRTKKDAENMIKHIEDVKIKHKYNIDEYKYNIKECKIEFLNDGRILIDSKVISTREKLNILDVNERGVIQESLNPKKQSLASNKIN